MIKALVLDIDGVIVGSKEGVNFPRPSKNVISALRGIHENGIPVSFLTGKPAFAAAENIKTVGIDNPHIADGGATIFNPIHGQIISSSTLNSDDILDLLRSLPNKTYLNIFTTKNYYLQKSLKNDFTKKYGSFLGRFPVLIDNLEKIAENKSVTKINILALRENEKKVLTHIIKKKPVFNYNWTTAPPLAPIQIMVVTAKGISKRSGVKTLANYLKVSTDEVLGVGDTIHDWDFLEICGYKAVMGNASQELKDKISINDPNQMICGHIDDDGILDVLKYFRLL